jgi:hypothetical protein
MRMALSSGAVSVYRS